MIFGKTDQQKQEEKRQKLIEKCRITKCFAWLPTEMNDGRTLWLETFFEAPVIYVNSCLEPEEFTCYLLGNNSWKNFYTEEEIKNTLSYKNLVKQGWIK